jgi:hypothetical protein
MFSESSIFGNCLLTKIELETHPGRTSPLNHIRKTPYVLNTDHRAQGATAVLILSLLCFIYDKCLAVLTSLSPVRFESSCCHSSLISLPVEGLHKPAQNAFIQGTIRYIVDSGDISLSYKSVSYRPHTRHSCTTWNCGQRDLLGRFLMDEQWQGPVSLHRRCVGAGSMCFYS